MTALRFLGVSSLAMALAGCGLGSFGGSPPPPPAPVKPAAAVPTMDIAATPSVVREVLVSRAQSRGSSPTLTASAVVIQRVLPSTNEALAAACGPHVPGRTVRVVLGTQAIAGGTRVTEQRFIVDGTKACPVPLSETDIREAEASLSEVKTQAETRVARR